MFKSGYSRNKPFIFLTMTVLFLTVSGLNVCAVDQFLDLDQCDPDKRQDIYKREILIPQEMVDEIYKLTKVAVKIFNNHNIDYVVHMGTLMGILRPTKNYPPQTIGGLLPGDDDVDFLVNSSEDQMNDLIKDFDEIGYNLFADDLVGMKIYKKESLALPSHKEIPIFGDIFLCELQKDKYVLSRERGRNFFQNSWIPAEDFDQKKQYNFADIKLWGPDHAEEYLDRYYGNQWANLGLCWGNHYLIPSQPYKWTLNDDLRKPILPSWFS